MEQNKTESSLQNMTISPVGVIKSEIKTPGLKAGKEDLELEQGIKEATREAVRIRTLISELVIYPEYVDSLDGIEEYSHLLILYWPHLLPEAGRRIKKVHPMGLKDFPLVGLFSTCSPARPNPILATAVRLIEREGNVLKVQGLEAVDGSPIIDIKPYNRSYLQRDKIETPAWMQQIEQALKQAEQTKNGE